MWFGQDRDQIRRTFAESWRKHCAGLPMEPLERMIAGVIAQHPEYQPGLESGRLADRDFLAGDGESNPFLHMGLHIALQEQISTDRPAGVLAVYHALAASAGDAHQAEHRMIECLAAVLWQAQRDGAMPEESVYLEQLRSLVQR
jgi:hypothetical protein